MLLCINGMSAEKTATIIKAYDTPIRLYRAFLDAEAREICERALQAKALQEAEASGNGKGRKKKSSIVPASLLLTQLPGSGRRHIGDALSTKVYELFRAQRY
jgi:crossover junction endonuclease MUS81